MIERDLFGYLLYTDWRNEQLEKAIWEAECTQFVEWPFDSIVGECEEEGRGRDTAGLDAVIRVAEVALF